jgi:hypothetical protein
MDVSDPFTFLALKRGVLQYVQVKPALALCTVLLKLTGVYKDGDLARDSGCESGLLLEHRNEELMS